MHSLKSIEIKYFLLHSRFVLYVDISRTRLLLVDTFYRRSYQFLFAILSRPLVWIARFILKEPAHALTTILNSSTF
jgi:phosphatidylserine decarboxylase